MLIRLLLILFAGSASQEKDMEAIQQFQVHNVIKKQKYEKDFFLAKAGHKINRKIMHQRTALTKIIKHFGFSSSVPDKLCSNNNL